MEEVMWYELVLFEKSLWVLSPLEMLVGARGFEPRTSCAQDKP